MEGSASVLTTMKFVIFCYFLCISLQRAATSNDTYTPIVLWHGMGDSCCFSFSLGGFQTKLNDSLPGVYIHSLRIGDSIISDVQHSYFMHPDQQINEACNMIQADPQLSDGFNAIGFSQGGQFLRALVQRCSAVSIKNLITLGGQHQGVYGLPKCGSLSNEICDYLRKLLNYAAYLSWVQAGLVQATYWHDPLNEELYRNGSTFLSDINNELTINPDYIENLQKLTNFVMVKFENDSMVQPTDSEWFGFYTPGQSIAVQSLYNSSIFLDDRLGLKRMDSDSKLHFLATPGDHLQFDWSWFEENVINDFLRN